jgi:kynurenine formamidase
MVGDTGERSCWGVFGNDDDLGCLNFIGPEQVTHAATLIRVGHVISLDLPLGEPQPQFWAPRPPLEHVVRVHRRGRDDHLNMFNLQGSTQWDGLRHVRFRGHGYYGGLDDDVLDQTGRLGMDQWGDRGIITRGIFIDVARYLAAQGSHIDPAQTTNITAEILRKTLQWEGVTIQPGDVLIVRSGWLEWYRSLSDPKREAIAAAFKEDPRSFHAPGIDPSLESVAWLWDSQVAGIAIDTPTFEVLPFEASRGWAHHRLLALLGMPLGELWKLDQLAAYCGANNRYAFFLSSAPLKLPQGVGTPANAYAIF